MEDLSRKLNKKLNILKNKELQYINAEKTGTLSKLGYKQWGYFAGCISTLEDVMFELNIKITEE